MAQQQLVARIKKSSKYAHQAPREQWFRAKIITDQMNYQLYGNHNHYRLADVSLGVIVDGGVVELATGKMVRTDLIRILELAGA